MVKAKHISRFVLALAVLAVLAVALAERAPDGEITGVCWHDLNCDGVRDPGEPGINGWFVELIDPGTYEVVDTCRTRPRDLDADGRIDPDTEMGVYSFTDVARSAP